MTQPSLFTTPRTITYLMSICKCLHEVHLSFLLLTWSLSTSLLSPIHWFAAIVTSIECLSISYVRLGAAIEMVLKCLKRNEKCQNLVRHITLRKIVLYSLLKNVFSNTWHILDITLKFMYVDISYYYKN